ncbi:MAG: acyl-CoA synthetase (AMP-forming)/AMP-acid ligase II [Parasphingorhabdus sp.]|mgnify:FL=1|jgi:acyl-CoA synthetase (AMP-forming)/AMP-acid ligase II|uniref:FadD3 family acyl-CoA ligase n=1 Tax=Parasphingorhabdus sp. TaxID=2709688 RepID=UPI0039E531CB|tara:strand:+ start:3652 stop:5253 length:1602 start_codon:yes stop_codon:yes gene_type:complete
MTVGAGTDMDEVNIGPETWPETVAASAAAAARRWPAEPALIENGQTWTFAALWQAARASASALLASGIGPGDRVAIWAPNCGPWIFAAIGAHICGAVLVPLNTRYKGQEAAEILRRTQAKMLFTMGDFLGSDYRALLVNQSLPDLSHIVAIEKWDDFLASGKGAADSAVDAILGERHGDELSDIIFTSGTTGAPKGVMTGHRQMIKMFGEWSVRVDLRQGDRHLIVNPFSHTFGYKAGWLACLLRGATIIPQAVFDEAETARLIIEHKVSFIPGPPAIYQSLLQAQSSSQVDFSSLRVAVTGGAPVPTVLIERMRSELGMRNIVNGYGMTEHGVITMTRQDDPPEVVASSCGYPMPGVELRCVDDDGQNVPLGTAGEIWVRSQGVMRGYLDDPVATAKAVDEDGWLHTGDIGTVDEQGYLRITDRKTEMFISGGFNCYPAEIESLLSRHPAIEMVAVIGVPDERMGEVGKAFAVLRPGTEATAEDICDWARDFMSNYKAPRSIEFVDALPRNAAGKVMRAELRDHNRASWTGS